MGAIDFAIIGSAVALSISKAVRAKNPEQRMDHVFNVVELLINNFRSNEQFMKRIREVVK